LVSGVGHEPDWMLIDFAADVRAATPTMAAEIVVPTKLALSQEIENLSHRLSGNFANRIMNAKQKIESVTLKSPKQIIMEQGQRLDDITRTMGIIINGKLASSKQSIESVSNFKNILQNKIGSLNQAVLHFDQMLNSLSYKSVLNRGYAIVRSGNKVISRASEFARPATLEFSDGIIEV